MTFKEYTTNMTNNTNTLNEKDVDYDEVTQKQLRKMKFKFLRFNDNYFYFDVKGNSFLRGRTKTLPEDFWASDWYDFSKFTDLTLIKANNLKDIEVTITK